MKKLAIWSAIVILLAGPMTFAQGKVDVNQANIKDLVSLSGMNEERARAIVRFREKEGPIRSTRDLAKVPGFSEEFIRANPSLVEELNVKR